MARQPTTRLPTTANALNLNVDFFLSQCHRRKYVANRVILNAGDTGDTLYFIVSGSVAVAIEDGQGRELILAYLHAGDFFGEMGLFEDKPVRSAQIKARTPCEIAEINYAKFKDLAHRNADLLFALSTQLANRLRSTTRKVGNLAFLDVTGRVARTLLDLCKSPGALSHPEGMQIKITRQEMGRIIGCSREMAGRVLKSMEEQGLVSIKGRTIVVHGAR